MDIPRAPAKRGRKQLLYSVLAIVAVVLASLGLHGLKPAAPRVDRAAVWIDSVVRGPLRDRGARYRERWYPSASGNLRGHGRPGGAAAGRAGAGGQVRTVLLELSNPDVQLEALESERQLTVSRPTG